jgi:hypothetical protein
MRDSESWQTTNQEYLEYLERLIQEAKATRDLVRRINRLPLPMAELEKLKAQRKQEAAVALVYYGVRDRLFQIITGQASLTGEPGLAHQTQSSV